MIKIKYIFDFLIFSLKRRYFGYNKTIGGSPSIGALSPLLEDICNCGRKKTAISRKLQVFGGSYFQGIFAAHIWLSCSI